MVAPSTTILTTQAQGFRIVSERPSNFFLLPHRCSAMSTSDLDRQIEQLRKCDPIKVSVRRGRDGEVRLRTGASMSDRSSLHGCFCVCVGE